jgi:hypothetical protein
MKRTAFGLSIAIAFTPALAVADGASSRATAEALFKEARTLMTSGKYKEACPKLAESQRLDPAAGTLLNLAECYDKNGQTASAWATFGEAARAAELRKRSDWKATADARVKELEPNLSYLVVDVDPETSSAPNLTITRDGEPLGSATWATAIPVDPGPHAIAATATGREPLRTTIEVGKARDRAVVHIKLEAAKVTTTTVVLPPPPPPEKKSAFPKTAVGLGVAGVGVAGIATGLVFGLMASSQNSTVDKECPTDLCSSREGLDANGRAHTFATVSTIAVIAGAVLAAAGVTIWLWPMKGEL